MRFGDWPGKELDVLNDLHLLTAKTSLYLVNMSEKDYIRSVNSPPPPHAHAGALFGQDG